MSEKERRPKLNIYDYEADFFSSMTTYHGLVRIYNSGNWITRWFWSAVVAGSFALFVCQASQLLSQLHEHPKSTAIEIDQEMRFPNITVCNFNPIHKSKLEENKTYENVTSDLLRFITGANLLPQTLMHRRRLKDNIDETKSKYYFEFIKKYENYTGQPFSTIDFFRYNGYSCIDMVKECAFGGGFTLNASECCERAVDVMTDFGVCTQFDVLKFHRLHLKLANHSAIDRHDDVSDEKLGALGSELLMGALMGLQFVFDLNINQTDENVMVDYADSGLLFAIGENGEFDGRTIGLSGSRLAPGQAAYVNVGQMEMRLLHKNNWGSCTNDWTEQMGQMDFADDADKMSPPTVDGCSHKSRKSRWRNYLKHLNYTNTNCQLNCLLNMYAGFCCNDLSGLPCVPMRYAHEIRQEELGVDVTICQADDLLDCLKKMSSRGSVAARVQEAMEHCRCGVECTYREFKPETSYSRIPNPNMAEYFLDEHNATSSYVEQNFAILSVFMKRSFFEIHHQQQAINRLNLLSSIGGSMGLFMGMSLITMAEIAVFMLKTFWGMLCKTRRSIVHARLKHAAHKADEKSRQSGQKSIENGEKRSNDDKNDCEKGKMPSDEACEVSDAPPPYSLDPQVLAGRLNAWLSKNRSEMRDRKSTFYTS